MEIPSYPDSRPILPEDKSLLDGIFRRLQPRISEFTFANIFLFRKAHAYRLTSVGDALVILGKGYGGADYFMPPLSGGVDAALARLFADGLALYGADEVFAGSHLHSGGLLVTEERDNFDYLYLREELAELPGNRFHKKKNRIAYFTSRHEFSVEEFSRAHVNGSLELLEDWRRVKSEMSSPSMAREIEAAGEALHLAFDLGLQGVVVLMAGKVRAFALGEELNRETSVCHFEKADPFMEGLSQLADREFNRRLFTGCRYVNREQDLGEPGLRDAKLSYHPVELVKKFRARLG